MYNRYQGNSGKVQRVNEKQKAAANRPPPPKAEPPKARYPKGNPPPLKNLSSLLPKGIPELETEDLILLLILYLMYRKSGDSDLLIMMGAMFLL